MKPKILIERLFDDDQEIFNSSKFLVENFGRKLEGFVENIWINDINFLIEFCKYFKSHNKSFSMCLYTDLTKNEESQITHYITRFPGVKMSEKDADFIDEQIGSYVDTPLAKDHGGYGPSIIMDSLKLRSKINISEGKIHELYYNELIATCSTIKSLIDQGADLIKPDPIGFNRDGIPVAILKSSKLAPPVQLDEALILDKKWTKYLSYYPAGIPSFKGLNTISNFARMRDSLVPTRSPLWILEINWINKLKKIGYRPKTIPVMEAGTELRKKYIEMLISIKEVVELLPGSKLTLAEL